MDMPNIVWITLDSIRADHTTMDGYHRDTTPNLNRIANSSSGEYFSQCFATGNATPFSSASILTGTYPGKNGLKIENQSLPNQIDTVPELLKEQGYTTACLSRNSYVSSGTGLDRGFDEFSWLSASTIRKEVGVKTLLKYLFNIRTHSAGFTIDTAKWGTPYLMNELSKQWSKKLKNQEPFFHYLHYNEPHRPYHPPLPYLDKYTDDLPMDAEEAVDIAMEVHRDLHEIIAHEYDLSEKEEMAIVAMYDAEIAYTDEMIGRLFEHYQSLNLENTIFVITADHGELFGEYGLLAHKLVLHDAVTHVPMVTFGFEDISHQCNEIIQHHDVMQTLLAKANISSEQFQGVDLRNENREYAISQRPSQDFEEFLQFNPEFDTNEFHSPMLTTFRGQDFKYQKSEEASELFKLPDEKSDVSNSYPEVAEKMEEDLSDWLLNSSVLVEATNETGLTNSMHKQLRDLGYLE